MKKITSMCVYLGLISKVHYLVSFYDPINDEYGYKNISGDTIIPLGKYAMCFTDTFKTYAIVVKPNGGFIAIDRQENVLYEIFTYDNGPDYTSDGLTRMVLLRSAPTARHYRTENIVVG